MSTILTGPGIGPINWVTVILEAALASTVLLGILSVLFVGRFRQWFWYWRLKRVIKCSRGTR